MESFRKNLHFWISPDRRFRIVGRRSTADGGIAGESRKTSRSCLRVRPHDTGATKNMNLHQFSSVNRSRIGKAGDRPGSIRRYKTSTGTRFEYRFSAFWLRSKCSICSYQLNLWYVVYWSHWDYLIFASMAQCRCLHRLSRGSARYCSTSGNGPLSPLGDDLIQKHDQ